MAVARCFFYTCTATQITVSLNKALRRGLLWPQGPPAAGTAAAAAPCEPGVRWRLDRDEVSSSFTRLRGNLFALFRQAGWSGERGQLLVSSLQPNGGGTGQPDLAR